MFKRHYLKRVRNYVAASGLLLTFYHIHQEFVLKLYKRDGTLVEDFLFAESNLSFHVCNAPSPAATSAIPIGEYLCEKVTSKFRF